MSSWLLKYFFVTMIVENATNTSNGRTKNEVSGFIICFYQERKEKRNFALMARPRNITCSNDALLNFGGSEINIIHRSAF